MGEAERTAVAEDSRVRGYRSGPFRIDSAGRSVTKAGEPVQLTPKGFDLLLLLIRNRDRVVPNAEIFAELWPGIAVTPANLRQQMFTLRQALGDGADEVPQLIINVPTLGYRFVGPVEAESEPPPPQPELSVAHAGADRRPRHSHAVRTALVVLLTALSVAAGYVMISLYRRGEPEDRPARPDGARRRSIAVLGFKNLSMRAEDRWLSSALAEMLAVELAVGGDLRTVPGEVVSRARADLDLSDSVGYAAGTLEKLRANLGADLILSGSYLTLSEGGPRIVRLDLTVQDSSNGETLFVASESGATSRLLDLVGQAGVVLRKRLASHAPVLSASTGSLAGFPRDPLAIQKYADGLSTLRRFDPPLARAMLDEAAAIEPSSAMILSALSDTWSALGYREKARDAAAKARELTAGLPRAQVLAIDGQYYAANGQWEQAAKAYAELQSMAPDDVEYGLKLAAAYREARSAADALQVIDGLRANGATDPRIDIEAARAGFILSEFPGSIDASRRAAAAAHAISSPLLEAAALLEEGRALSASGDQAGALRAFESARDRFKSAGDTASLTRVYVEIGRLTLSRGDLQAALGLFKSAYAGSEKIGDMRGRAAAEIGTGAALVQLGDRLAALTHLQAALAIYRETGDRRNAAIALHNVASVEVALGRLASAAASYQESASVLLDGGFGSGAGTALASQARLMLRCGELSKAEESARKAGELLEGKGSVIDQLWYQTLLVEIALEKAELKRAYAAIAEMERLTTAAGSALHNGLSLRYRADCLRASGHDDAARVKLAEARKVFSEAGQQSYSAGCDDAEARIELASGRSAAAAALAAKAAHAIGGISEGQFGVTSRALLARCRALQGDRAGARRDADIAWKEASTGEDVLVRLGVIPDVAAVMASTGDRDAARELLQRGAAEAARRGLLAVRFETEITLAEIEREAGRAEQARSVLGDLVRLAESHGYTAVASRGKSLLIPPE